MNIRKRLKEEANEKYKIFSSSLIPNINNILGVRLPILRKLSKEILKNNWQTFLKSESLYFEETMLKGMVIGLINDAPENIIKYIDFFIPKINNWSVCDSFCSGLKFTKNNQIFMWNYIKKYALSDNEFEARFAFVMMINYFINDEYIDEIFNIINKFKLKKYFAQMSVAWLISCCFVKYTSETISFLKESELDKFTYNKSIQKIMESKRVDKNTKLNLKNLYKK